MSLGGRIYRGALTAHEAIYEATDGRVGPRLLGVPTLLLRTAGRRTGQTRCNALVYARDGERYLVVPSNGGARRAPGWYHNLRAQPEVEIQIGRERQPAAAAIVNRGDGEFERLWKAVNDNNRGLYETYQARTERSIPVVALSPTGR